MPSSAAELHHLPSLATEGRSSKPSLNLVPKQLHLRVPRAPTAAPPSLPPAYPQDWTRLRQWLLDLTPHFKLPSLNDPVGCGLFNIIRRAMRSHQDEVQHCLGVMHEMAVSVCSVRCMHAREESGGPTTRQIMRMGSAMASRALVAITLASVALTLPSETGCELRITVFLNFNRRQHGQA